MALKTEQLAGQFENPVQWFYDPMAVTAFGGQMNEIATVYDCMDELSKFKMQFIKLVLFIINKLSLRKFTF